MHRDKQAGKNLPFRVHARIARTKNISLLPVTRSGTSRRMSGWFKGGESWLASLLCPLGKYRARSGLCPSPRHRQHLILPTNATSRCDRRG